VVYKYIIPIYGSLSKYTIPYLYDNIFGLDHYDCKVSNANAFVFVKRDKEVYGIGNVLNILYYGLFY
jgi:hypothetical protein